MGKFRFVLIFDILWGCCCISIFGDVFLDNSQVKCVRNIEEKELLKNTKKEELSGNTGAQTCYECLKSCLEKWKGAKIAAFDPVLGCFCSNLSYDQLFSDNNITGCISDASNSISQPQFKIYNMSGFTVRFRFNEYVKQNSRFKVDLEVLLYENGTSTNDSNLLKQVLSPRNCEVRIRNSKTVLHTWCLGNFNFTSLGKNEICLKTTGNVYGICRDITVVAPVVIDKIKFMHGQHGTSLQTKMTGTVFNISYAFDDILIETFHIFSQFEEKVFEFCYIEWNVKPHAVMLGKTRKFLINVYNPLSRASREKSFKISFPGLHLTVSYFLSAASDNIKTTVEARGNDDITGYEDLKYKWYLHGSCKNVTLFTNLTTVAKVTLISNSDIQVLLRFSCKISLVPVGADGSSGRAVTARLFTRNLIHATRRVFAVDFPTDYVLRGKEATFGIKKNNNSKTPEQYIWRVNGKEMSRNKTFRHIFNELGRYSVYVYGYWPTIVAYLASKNVSVREKLTTLEISVSSSHYFGGLVIMRAVTNFNDYVTYYWNFGDGEHCNTSRNTISHRYYKPGMYTVHLVANNGVSHMKTNKTIDIIVLCPECEFETSFEDGKEVDRFRSLPIHLEVATKKLVCLEPVTIIFRWTVTKWTNKWSEWRDWEHQKMKSTESIYIASNVLDYGKYSFNVTVNVSAINSSVWHSEKFSCIINVIESPLYAIVRGGFSRYIRRNSTFFLDASLSYYPDNLNADLRFSWSFTRGGKTIELGRTAVIAEDTMRLNILKSMEFKVIVWYGKRRNETTQTMTIQDIKTNMVLDCPSCDLGHLNPSSPTLIMEKCVDNCPPSEEVLWQLLEMRKEYGLPILKSVRCTGSQSPPQNLRNKNRSTSVVPYAVHYCEDAAMGIQEMTSLHVCHRLTDENPSCEPSNWIHLVFKRSKPHSEMLSINRNYFPGNKIFTIRRKEDEYVGKVAAERFFRVQGRPHEYFCAMKPIKGVELKQDFEITCDVDKNAGLLYKVVYERKKADGSSVSNIFFQRKVPSFKFQLPSGDLGDVHNSIFISIENENGVARDYCVIFVWVTAIKPGPNINSIEEYLYNRSLTVSDEFSDHPYIYHGQTLFNITLISEVLNRQPSVSNSTKIFHLRAQIREILIDILNKITVSTQYISRQFASSLESCTRVPEELTNGSVAAVVEILYKLMRRERHGIEQGMDLAEDFQTNILNVSSRIIHLISPLKRKDHDAKLLESLTYLFEDTLRTKFVRTPLEIISIKKSCFDASLMKFSPYRSENIDFMCGETHITIKTRAYKAPTRPYHCDLFGCGLQAVTMDADPFGDDNTYQKLSSVTKLKTHDCKQFRNCQEKITAMKILFPIRSPKSTWKPAVYNLSSRESHLFTLKWNIPNILNIELVPLGLLSWKLKLRLDIRCADEMRRSLSNVRFSTHMDRIEKFFTNFSSECKELNVRVNINWEVQPTRFELLRTVVKYNLNIRWLGCLSKKRDNGKWSEKLVTPELDNPLGNMLKCRFSKLQGADSSYIAAAKTWPHDFKVIAVGSERNGIINIVMLAMSLFYVVIVLVLLFKERHQYKNNTAIPLERCDPSHTHKYKVTVYTGHCCGAGTTAKVAVVLHGENNLSYPVQLFTENCELFRRNSKDVFVVSVREDLDALKCIHLWHDNSGSSPSWFVDKLIIKDLSTNQKWIFRCCRWLAVDKHDGMLDCKIKPLDYKDNLSFKKFQFALGEKLMDFHIWLSLIRMPTYSTFTRAERLTCCVTLLFAYLFFNAYFCHHYKDFSIDCLSVFNPTWMQFKVGLLSTLAFLPVYLLFATIFRYTKSFVCVQLKKGAQVVSRNTTPIRKENIDKPSTLEKCDKLVCEMDRWSESVRRRKQLELAALLVKSFSEEDCEQEDERSEEDAISRRSPVTMAMTRSRAHTETELSSDTSGSLLDSQKPKLFRFPNFFNVLVWIGCFVTLILSSWYTVEYVSRFDEISLRCYKQSVIWSLFISIFISQPIQTFIVAVIKMVRRHFILHSTTIDEVGKENEEDVVLDDSMFACFTEKNFEDPLYRKLLCLKYLQPLSRKAVAKARCKLQKRKTTVVFIRDVLMYSLFLVFLYFFISHWNQKLVFWHNENLKTILNRDAKTSSLLTWWSSSPQNFIDTLAFDKESATVRAFHNKTLVIGNPKMTMTYKYCNDTLHHEIGSSLANESKTPCTRKVDHKTISFDKRQKENWLSLSDSFHKHFNQYVADVSVQFVIYSTSLDEYSVIKLSSHVIMGSRVQNEVLVTTAGFYVDKSLLQTIFQLLFTLVPVLLIIRQINSTSKDNKGRTTFGVKIEFVIVLLSIYSVISMWIWIKCQYKAVGFLLNKQHEANIIDDVETMYKYEEIFKFSVAFTLFFVLIKVCHVVAVDKLLDRYIETFTVVISLVLFPLFGLLLIFVAFAHMGVLLFGDHLIMFETFWQALSLNVALLRRTGTENFIEDSRYQQMFLAIYVIVFCVCMMLFSNLVKAAFCNARAHFLLTKKRKRKTPIKVYVFRKIRWIFSLLQSYLQEHEDEEETLKQVPMSFILKELDEQVNDLEFRVTHLICKEKMPAKAPLTPVGCSSSDGSDVEYVYKENNNERSSFSSFHRDLSSRNSCFEYPNHENIADSNVECRSRQSSSAFGSMTTHAETAIPDTSKLTQRRPFEISMRAFPTPINETLTSYGHALVLLDPFLGEEAANATPDHALASAEQDFAIDYNVNDARNVSSLNPRSSWNRTARGLGNHTTGDHEHSPPIADSKRSVHCTSNITYPDFICKNVEAEGYCTKNKGRSGNERPEVIVNSFKNNAFEGDAGDLLDNIMPSRSKVRLDAFDDEPSLDKKCLSENVHTAKNKLGFTSDKKPQGPFQQPVFPLTITSPHLFTRSSEV